MYWTSEARLWNQALTGPSCYDLYLGLGRHGEGAAVAVGAHSMVCSHVGGLESRDLGQELEVDVTKPILSDPLLLFKPGSQRFLPKRHQQPGCKFSNT